jgi:hypothetical protein
LASPFDSKATDDGATDDGVVGGTGVDAEKSRRKKSSMGRLSVNVKNVKNARIETTRSE